MQTYRQICISLLLLLLWGCASVQPQTTQQQPVQTAPPDEHSGQDALPEGEGWWAARFRIVRPDGEPPRWYVGALLAGEVIAPVFETRYRDILVWRVHRRAGNDDYGHVFSFIFYSTPEAARRIYADISANPVLAQLRQENKVSWVGFDDLHKINKPYIEDTSDPHWSVPVQKTWPALIMGASRMWLDLVGELADTHADVADLEQRYELVQQDLTGIWANEGQHAVLHHMSAIFAYQPLLIKY